VEAGKLVATKSVRSGVSATEARMPDYYFTDQDRTAQLRQVAALCSRMAAALENAAAYKEHMSAYRMAAKTFAAWAEAPKKVYSRQELQAVYPPDFYLYKTQFEKGATYEMTPAADEIPAWYREMLALREEISKAFSMLTVIGERR
jgi:hypothetical protein